MAVANCATTINRKSQKPTTPAATMKNERPRQYNNKAQTLQLNYACGEYGDLGAVTAANDPTQNEKM